MMRSSEIRRYSSWWRFKRTRTERWGWFDRTESITFYAFGRRWHLYNRKERERAALRALVFQMREDNMTVSEISESIGISRSVVRNLCREAINERAGR